MTGDEVYGANPHLRAELEARGVGYVLAVACDHQVVTGGQRVRADVLAARVPKPAWQTISVGCGAKGRRLYDWTFVRLDDAERSAGDGWPWLLTRRNRSSGELAFYRCWTPRPVPLATLAQVAGPRWRIEETFQAGKGLCGLDQHQVRRWRSWYRWTTLGMVALAFLAVVAGHRAHPAPDPGLADPADLQRAQAPVHRPDHPAPSDPGHRLRWSVWRRRHQARARTCHYRRQATQP